MKYELNSLLFRHGWVLSSKGFCVLWLFCISLLTIYVYHFMSLCSCFVSLCSHFVPLNGETVTHPWVHDVFIHIWPIKQKDCIISNFCNFFSRMEQMKSRRKKRYKDRQRHWRWKQSCVWRWGRSGSENVHNVEQCWCCECRPWDRTPGHFPSVRLPRPAAQPRGRDEDERTDRERSFLSHILLEQRISLAFPWAFTLLGRLCSLRGMLGNSPSDRLWLACLVTPHSQWEIHQGHRHSVCFWNCERLYVEFSRQMDSLLCWSDDQNVP